MLKNRLFNQLGDINLMNKKIRAILTGIALILSASIMAQQSVPALKKYKWHHPWFNKEIVSDSPPAWPYKVIEEKNGVIFVEVNPPRIQKESASPASTSVQVQEPLKATTTIPPLSSPSLNRSNSVVEDERQKIYNEATYLLEQGKSMEPLRHTNNLNVMRTCGETMRKLQPQAKELRSRADRLSNDQPKAFLLKVAVADLFICVSCANWAIKNCGRVEAGLKEAR